MKSVFRAHGSQDTHCFVSRRICPHMETKFATTPFKEPHLGTTPLHVPSSQHI